MLLASPSYPSSFKHYSRSRTLSSTSHSSSRSASPARSLSPAPSASPRLGSSDHLFLAVPSSSPSSPYSSSSSLSVAAAPTAPGPLTTSIKMDPTEPTTTAAKGEQDDGLYEEMDTLPELGTSSSSNSLHPTPPAVDLSKMTPAERREHSRKHSRVHSRNLSVFFPRPGTEAELEADQAQAQAQYSAIPSPQPISIGSASTAGTGSNANGSVLGHRRTGSGNRPQITVSTDPSTLSPRSASFAQASANITPPTSSQSSLGATPHTAASDLSPSPTRGRRGHHHKHSVSYAAMADSGLSPASAHLGGTPMSYSSSASSFYSEGSLATPAALTPRREASDPFSSLHKLDHHHDHHHHHHHDQGKHFDALNKKPVNALLRVPLGVLSLFAALPASSRPLALFGLAHFALGASLWVAGQAADSLAATGLGYLVVFDSMGVLSGVVADYTASTAGQQGTRDKVRKPYGSHRLPTLLHFVQSIYLLFSSLYVLKESVEHALLEGGGGHSGGERLEAATGHEHSHVHNEHSYGLVLPTLLLALSVAACLFSNVVLGNHTRLVAACGISTAASGGLGGGQSVTSRSRGNGHGRSGSVLVHPSALASPLLILLANPFSLTVLFFSTTLLFASLTMPAVQVAALDKVLAGLESVSMFYVAYPASVALGRVLLQTAPSSGQAQRVQLDRALRVVSEHPLVRHVDAPQLWQLTPPTSSVRQATGAGAGASGGLVHHAAKSPALIASVRILLTHEASESDCLDMTRWAWERLAPSVAAASGLNPGEMLRGTLRAGELTVAVRREGWQDDGVQNDAVYADAHHGHGHDHDHHHHDHDHDHDHDHGHGHGHEDHHHHHHHDHDHSHHGHDHAHVHDHAAHHHDHDHDHGHGHAHVEIPHSHSHAH